MRHTLTDRHAAMFALGSLVIVAGIAILAPCRAEPAVDPGPRPALAVVESHRAVQLHVDGLTCEGCAWAVRERVQQEPGVAGVTTSVREKLVTIRYDQAQTSPQKLKDALAQLGYPATSNGGSSCALSY